MKMRMLVATLLLLPNLSSAATECIGSSSALHSVVYLHGMDTAAPSAQELHNRQVLTKLANDLQIRFALPRASSACPTSPKQICWTWAPKTQNDLGQLKAAITTAANDCFPAKPYNVLGFSNGGVAAQSFLRLCENVEFKTVIAVGAAGSWYSGDPRDLRGCASKVISLVGLGDSANLKPVHDFVSHLQSMGATATLVEFAGGHELLYEPLREQLSKLQ